MPLFQPYYRWLMNSLTAYALNDYLDASLRGGSIKRVFRHPGLLTLSTAETAIPFAHVVFAGSFSILLPDDSTLASAENADTAFTRAEDAVIIRAGTMGTDRVVFLDLKGKDSWSEGDSLKLILDFTLQKANAALFESASGKLLASTGRDYAGLARGPKSSFPASGIPITALPTEPPEEILRMLQGETDTASISSRLPGLIAGTDPFLSDVVSKECGGNIEDIWKLLREIGSKLTGGPPEWHVYGHGGGATGRTFLYPVALPGNEPLFSSGRYQEAARFQAEQSAFPFMKDMLRKKASREAAREVKRLIRLKKNLASDMENARRFQEFRHYGDLLTTNFNALRKGAETVTLDDFEGSGKVIIPLDGRLPPRQNIERYYRKARKGEKGLKKIGKRLDSVERGLKEASKRVEKILSIDDLDTLFSLARERGEKANREKEGRKGRFKRFLIDGRYTVYVGRNARENDLLTHSFASRRDLWFHARGVPGSHVVLKGANPSTPPEILERVAAIAAYYSKSRNSKIVPVSYTEKRYVRKPRKSAAGTAVLERESTLFVAPSLPSSVNGNVNE